MMKTIPFGMVFINVCLLADLFAQNFLDRRGCLWYDKVLLCAAKQGSFLPCA